MKSKTITGGEALALGAIASGVGCVASYPGSPGTATVAMIVEIIRLGKGTGCHVEWSANERVALEVAMGASLAGRRSLVCTKSVGMNVLLDPLMALNLTPLSNGIVIVLGDDPGAYGSQNDQDTRNIADLIELPMLEPPTPIIGLEMICSAFDISEQFKMPVVIRITRSFDVSHEDFDHSDKIIDAWNVRKGNIERDKLRFVPYPKNAVSKHENLHQRLNGILGWINRSHFDVLKEAQQKKSFSEFSRGVICAGFCMSKFSDVICEEENLGISVLTLAAIYPLPEDLICRFLNLNDEILILEENEPYLELRIKAIAQTHQIKTLIRGKLTGDFNRWGELFRWQIKQKLSEFHPSLKLANHFSHVNQNAEYPFRESHCRSCPFDLVLDEIDGWLQEIKQDAWIVADPGCLALHAHRLHAKYALGSAISVADGLSIAGQRAIALFGDSAFFHSALPALCNASTKGTDLPCIIIDYSGAVTTGGQPHPGLERSAVGMETKPLDVLSICISCGASFAECVELKDMRKGLNQMVLGSGVRVLVVKVPCSH